jgi:hypothetical protein
MHAVVGKSSLIAEPGGDREPHLLHQANPRLVDSNPIKVEPDGPALESTTHTSISEAGTAHGRPRSSCTHTRPNPTNPAAQRGFVGSAP